MEQRVGQPFHWVDDVACTKCGCVCDDLRVKTDGGSVSEVVGSCELSRQWFLSQRAVGGPAAWIDGESVDLERALEKSAAILERSQAPLIYGLARSSTPGQRAAVALADHLGASIDTTASRRHGPSIVALQEVGESTCSLGEARHRCDLVVFWGADPATSHPRHGERYSLEPIGQQLPRGRADRTVWVVDPERTKTVELADRWLRVPPGSDFELLWCLRALLRGIEPSSFPAGVDEDMVREFASRLQECRSSIFYFGLGLTRTELAESNVEALLRLVTELNGVSRSYARRMRIPGDIAGADSVLCWQTGYPFSVNLALGFPRYSPGEYSAEELIVRGETDAVLVIGGESLSRLSSRARARLEELPVVLLDEAGADPNSLADVVISTGVYGVHASGTAYRMDETPIHLRAFLDSNGPTDESVLNALRAATTRRLDHLLDNES